MRWCFRRVLCVEGGGGAQIECCVSFGACSRRSEQSGRRRAACVCGGVREEGGNVEKKDGRRKGESASPRLAGVDK